MDLNAWRIEKGSSAGVAAGGSPLQQLMLMRAPLPDVEPMEISLIHLTTIFRSKLAMTGWLNSYAKEVLPKAVTFTYGNSLGAYSSSSL